MPPPSPPGYLLQCFIHHHHWKICLTSTLKFSCSNLSYVFSAQENSLFPQAREKQEMIYAYTKLTQVQCSAVLPFTNITQQ